MDRGLPRGTGARAYTAPHLQVGARWEHLVGIWLPRLSPKLGIVEGLDLGWRHVYAEDSAIECRGVPLRRGAPFGADRHSDRGGRVCRRLE